MVDAPESNSTNLLLAGRGLRLFMRETEQNRTDLSTSKPTMEGRMVRCWYVAFLVVLLSMAVVILFCCCYPKFLRRITTRYTKLFIRTLFYLKLLRSLLVNLLLYLTVHLKHLAFRAKFYIRLFLVIVVSVLFLGFWVLLLVHIFRRQQSWSAASDFLASCKVQQVSCISV
jgi:hypothetical protein